MGVIFSMEKMELSTPVRTIIIKVLSYDPEILSVFGRTKEKDLFFKDLLTVGCDFYELLELYSNCEAINQKNVTCIVESIPTTKVITDYSEKGIRRIIPHWSSSKYHTATIEDVCNEIKHHIENDSEGIFVYNSNANLKNKKIYNDTYILLIADSNKFFFDINRKKAYKIINDSEVAGNV